MKRLLFLLFMVLLTTCATQEKVLYLQNLHPQTSYETFKGGEIKLQAGDEVSIVVSSRNPELAAIFNLNRPTTNGVVNTSDYLTYTIDPTGEINFPVIGKLRVVGLTKAELTHMITDKIVSSGMLNDPIVTVDFENLIFSTIGDVTSPNVYNIKNDKTTIFEAISMSGDLAITAQRDKVFVTRDRDGVLTTYQLDLRSTDIYKSPAFYIQQNDLIYVEPNKVRSNQSTINANSILSVSFWVSISSFVISLVLLFSN